MMEKNNFILRLFKNFRELTRAYAIGTTAASCLVILAYGIFNESFNLVNFVLLFFALLCVHLGANLYDDYIDVKNKLKKGVALQDVQFSSFTPKARLITKGFFSMKQVEIIVSVLFLLAAIVGIHFILLNGPTVLYFMFAGGLLTLFYPISSKFYMSELVIGLVYGPLMINGGYFALCGSFNPSLCLLSFAIFFTTLVLLHVHNLMDYEFDVENGKNTLCVLLKDKRYSILLLKIFLAIPYAIVAYGVIKHNFNPYMLYTFLTLPVAVKLIETMKDYINIKDVKFEPRWYFGPFENWKEIQKQNIAFYMYRLYLSRNYLFFFAIFIFIGALI